MLVAGHDASLAQALEVVKLFAQRLKLGGQALQQCKLMGGWHAMM
jgi:hypothetical protein